MKPFYKALTFGILISVLKYLLWKTDMTFWDLSLISISGLIAGIFFSLTIIFRSALMDYKEADKNICNIRGKICAMNDLNANAQLCSKRKYKGKKLSKYLIEVLQTIKKYLQDKASFNKLQDTLDQINEEAHALDRVVSPGKVSRFMQYQDHLRGFVSYLEYGKSLHFAKVGYVFLYFFIFALIVLQLFAQNAEILLEIIFIFSLSSVLIFFAELIRDLDKPFEREKAAFAVDLSPLDKGIKTIQRSLK